MRITVSLVVDLVANGMSADEIVREYPDLEPEDIREAFLRFGAGQRGSEPIFEPRGVKLLADMGISMTTVRALREGKRDTRIFPPSLTAACRAKRGQLSNSKDGNW
jgi:hypothetical protein